MIPLELPPDEAAAFAQFTKRIDYDTVGRFTAVRVIYGGRTEHDVAWCAVTMLRRQMSEAGCNPRGSLGIFRCLSHTWRQLIARTRTWRLPS